MRLLEILDVEFDNIRISEAVERSVRSMEEGGGQFVLLLDSQQLLRSRKSRMLMNVLSRALLVLPADKGIVAAARILGLPFNYKMSALDYSSALMARISEMDGTVFILTDKPGIAQRASDDLHYRFPGIRVVGTEDISYMDGERLMESIELAAPDLVVLAMGYTEQMNMIRALAFKSELGLILGIGRAMDAYTAKRGDDSYVRRLTRQPDRELKNVGIVAAALKKRIFG